MEKTKELRWRLISFIGLALMMCFVIIQSSITVFAAEGTIKVDAAKVRAEASTSSTSLGSATRNTTFTIIDEVTGTDGKVWYQIDYEGRTGYVRSDLMTKKESTGTAQPAQPTVEVTDVQPVSATVTGSVVRVRSDATTEGSTILASVMVDSVVTITGQAKDSQNKIWYRVTFSSDSGEVTGFIREDFLNISGTITPVENIPVTPPVEDTPATPAPETPVVRERYYVVEDDSKWYLVDRDGGYQYETSSLIEAAIENPIIIKEYQEKLKSQKTAIIILVILVVALGVGATLLFLKMREVMDEAYFAAVEKETIRQRQGQKANNPSQSSGNKKVMHTVGAGGNNGNKSGQVASKTPVQKSAAARPVQQGQKPAGSVPQTVKVSNPADTRTAKPANAQQKPAGTATQKPAGTAGTTQQKPVSQAKPVQQKPAEKPWNSKNFVADEDDEFEFEFLNWDGNEDD